MAIQQFVFHLGASGGLCYPTNPKGDDPINFDMCKTVLLPFTNQQNFDDDFVNNSCFVWIYRIFLPL